MVLQKPLPGYQPVMGDPVTPDPGQLVRGLIPLWFVYANKDDLADDLWPKELKCDQLLILLGVKVNISPAPTELPVRPRVLWLRDV